jgi:hypothetical protein
VYGRDWHLATALAVYWLESLLLVLATAWLCYLLERRTSAAEVNAAGANPRQVLGVGLFAVFCFGGFFGLLLVNMIGNDKLEPMRWDEVRAGFEAMLAVVGVSFLLDLWRFQHFTFDAAKSRVNEFLARLLLLWMLGFFGSGVLMATESVERFFGFFAGLKITFESWGRLARFFGWRSLKERAADGAPPA